MKDIAAPLAQALDGVLPVCTGSSRLSKRWTNTTITWGDLCTRLSRTKRTRETVEQYHAMSKEQRAKVKDKGGIVCGHLIYDVNATGPTSGRKTKDNILNRSIITLDMDECPEGLNPVEIISEKLPGIAAVAYTTHSHTPEAPRWRVFIPLSEWVSPFFYEGIARYVGSVLGMEFLDKTTFQYNRLMYWPSTSIDGEYLCKVVDGSPISPRKFFEAYPAMKRESAWPRHPDEEPVEKRSPLQEREGEYSAAGKPGAPVNGPGAIGAFCRAYTMEEAISTFLSEVYKPEGLGRYTYINGSSSGGLTIYPEGLAFSYHSTDPANTGHCLNSFDLVRIHKFGYLDKNAAAGCKGNTLPSYQKMCDFVWADSKVSALRYAQIKSEFEEIKESELSWVDDLDLDKKGNLKSSTYNLQTILLNDEVFRRIKYNELTNRDEIDDPSLLYVLNKELADGAYNNIAVRLEKKYLLKFTEKEIYKALGGVASRHSYNPVRDYILSIPWDGVKRAETVLIDYMGAADTPLVRAQTLLWLVGAVRRALEPGTKFDYMLVLVGPQGTGKSTFFWLLGKSGEFYNETLSFDLKLQQQIEIVHSSWIFEVPELSGMKTVKDQDKIKSFLSMTQDQMRPVYRMAAELWKRHCALGATTNDQTFLGDLNSRKFWVIDVQGDPHLRDKLTPEVVQQIWAECYKLHLDGIDIYLPDQLEMESRKVSQAHNAGYDDPLLGVIVAFLDYRLPANWRTRSREDRCNYIRTYSQNNMEFTTYLRRNSICAAEIKNELDYWFRQYEKKTSSQYINRLLTLIGWRLYNNGEPKEVDSIYGRHRNVFIRPGADGQDERFDKEEELSNEPVARLFEEEEE